MYKTKYIIARDKNELNNLVKEEESLGYTVIDTLIRGNDVISVMQKDHITGLN